MFSDMVCLLTLGAALALPVLGVSASCSRTLLEEGASRYVVSQSTGQIGWLRKYFASNVTYLENGKPTDFDTGSLNQSVKVDHSRSSYDTVACASFTELISSNPRSPRIVGTQLRYSEGKIVKIDSITTGATDWLFNASHTLHYALQESWDLIPAEKRDSRETIKAAGDAYFDYMKNQSVLVPWGSPCARLEGGAYTGKGLANDTCNLGIPPGSNMTAPDRRYVIDESFGTVSILTYFGAFGNAPDSHEFRVEGGKLRYIHTMTYCGSKFNCGLTRPAVVSEDLGY